MNRIRNQYNYSLQPKDVEHPFGVSLTVPDQTLPITELIARYTRGQEIFTFQPVYHGEEPLPDLVGMDYQDRHELLRDINLNIAIRKAAMAAKPSHVEDAVVEDQVMNESKPNKPKKSDKSDD